MNKIAIFLFFLLVLFPFLVSPFCSCESEEDEYQNKTEALKYKLVAVAIIFIAGAIGVSLPILGKIIPAFHPENNIFFLVKAFAGGIILATGFVHILPEAFVRLSSPCLREKPWANFPFSGFVAMLSSIAAMIVDVFVTNHVNRLHLTEDSNVLDSARKRVISQVVGLGITVHSRIIGVSLGVSDFLTTYKPLVAALTFYQLLEGMGLGGCISQANFKARTKAIMAILFSITTPVGIFIGIGISNIYVEKSPTALILEGTLESASAGILVYVALVDLLSVDFMSPKMQSNLKLRLGSTVSLLLGAGSVSLLAMWV